MKDRVDLGVFVGMEYVLLPHLVSTNIPYMRYAVHCNFYTRLYIMYDHIQIVHTTSSIVQLFEYCITHSVRFTTCKTFIKLLACIVYSEYA